MKRKLFLFLCALLTSVSMWADVSLNAFSQVKEAWGGSGGVTKDVYLVERYYTSRPTGLIMAQAVSSIPNGTYDVVVIAHACHANGVGGDFVASNNTLSVNESSQTVATIDNSAVADLPLTEYTFSDVSVTDGTMNIKFSSDAEGANWFTIRVKSVTLKGNYEDKTNLLTNADFSAQTGDNQDITGWTTVTTFKSHINGDGFTGTFAEIWRNNNTAIPAGELSQTVNLPAGVYALSANIRSRRVTSHLFATIGGKEQKHTHIGDDGIGVRSLTFVVNQTSDVTIGFKNDANSTTGADKWVAVDDIKITRLGDVGETSLTSQIANPSFESGDLSLWTNSDMEVQTNMSFAGIQGHIYAQRWHSAGEKSVKQTLSGIPSGRYRLTVNAQDGGGTGVKVYAGDKETAVTSLNDYNVDFISNGSDVEIGYKGTGTSSSWLAVDNFRLTYYGPVISANAVELPGGGAMTAGTWYYFTAASGDKRISASTPADIVITTDGDEVVTGGTALTSYTGKLVSGTKYYIKSTSAQTITIETSVPSLAEGTYYFKVAKAHNGTNEIDAVPAGKYLSRGRASGTHATLDTYGLPIEVAVLANGYYSLSPADTKRFYYHASSWDCWADKDAVTDQAMFELTLTGGKYKIRNVAMPSGRYLKYNNTGASDATVPVYDDGTGTNSGPYILWTTESLSDHATAMTALKNSQAATAAAAAYASGNYSSLSGITTVSGLETALASYIQGDFVKPSEIETVTEKYQGGQPGGGNIVEIVYSNTIDITQAGLYKFSMQAFYRAASNETTQALHTAGADFPPVVLYFGSAETQIKSVYDEGSASQIVEGWGDVTYEGQHYPNNTDASLIMFKNDNYHNDVWLYVSEPGTYSYGVKYMGYANQNMQWFIYSPESVTITSYAEAATSADYTALSDAIDAYDDATWGFETGEYAPYNNVSAINKIEDARAIDPEQTNSKLLVNSLTDALALSVNATEVNAFGNDGAFSTTKGWENSAWVTTEGNFVGVPNGTTITYGNIAGYTVPLKANTIYELKLRHSGWDSGNADGGGTVSMLLGEDGLKDATYTGNPSSAKGDDSKYLQETFLFKTGAAGNYVFTLTGNGGRTTVKDFSLVSVPSKVSVEFGASGFATFACDYPVALPNDESVKGYTASIEDATINFNKLTDKLVPANTGVMLSGTPNEEMELDVVTSADAQSSDFIRGTGATPGEDDDYYFFAIKKSAAELTFGTFDPTSIAIAKNKAYFKISKDVFSKPGARLVISFDDEDPTGINAVEAAEAEAEGLKDGKYLIDNKIVLVKNGVKYSANGQILK